MTVRPGRGLRVLVAEDNAANQKLMSAMLASGGHQVVVVGDGREVLARLLDPAEGPAFDLVLMDVQMPELNGLETTAAIRAREKATGRHIPIIALTAHALAGDRERCLAAGMDDYLAKPIQRAELQRVIEEYGGPTRDAEPRATRDYGYDKSTLDLDAIRDVVGGNVDVLREILELFPEESARLMGDLEKAITRRDALRTERAAHSLKGMLGSLNAADAHQAALQLEELARGGELDRVGDVLATLQDRMRQLQEAIDEACRGLP